MSAETDPVDSAAMLERILAILGTSHAALRRSQAVQPGEAAGMGLVLDCLADPQGLRIARAVLAVADPGERRALADTVVAIAGTMNLDRAARA